MKKLLGLIILATLFTTNNLSASEKNAPLPFGSSTIGSGKIAVTLSLGFEIPQVIPYNLRADFGVFSHFQTGFSAWHGAKNNFNVSNYNKFNFFTSSENRHLLSAHTDFSYTSLNESSHLLTASPAIGYEYRFKTKRPRAFYSRLGTTHVLASSNGSFSSVEFGTFSTRKDTITLNHIVGFEGNLGGLITLGLELGHSLRLSNRSTPANFVDKIFKSNIAPTGKIFFSFVF